MLEEEIVKEVDGHSRVRRAEKEDGGLILFPAWVTTGK
jgi:hypothetical protein